MPRSKNSKSKSSPKEAQKRLLTDKEEISLENPSSSSYKIPKAFRFYIAHRDIKKITNWLQVRKKNYYLSSIRTPLTDDSSAVFIPMNSERFRRNCKYLRSVDTYNFSNKLVERFLHNVRQTKRLVLRASIENRDYHLLKFFHTRRISDLVIFGEFTPILLHKVLTLVKGFRLKSFRLTMSDESFMFLINMEIMSQIVVKNLVRFTNLEYLCLEPTWYFSDPNLKLGSKISSLPRLRHLIVHSDKAMYRRFLYSKQLKREAQDYFQSLNNLKNLLTLSVEVYDDSIPFIRRVFQESLHLKSLHLLFRDDRRIRWGVANFPREFRIAFKEIQNLKSLEKLLIFNGNLKEEPPPAMTLFQIHPICQLKMLKHFTLLTDPKLSRRLIDYGDLGKALGEAKQLSYLKIEGYFSNDRFEKFFLSSSKDLTELEEIEFNLQFYQEIKVGKEFKGWLEKKTKVKSFRFLLGTYTSSGRYGSLPIQTVQNVLDGISILPRLRYLVLGLGTIGYNGEIPSLKGFETQKNSNLVSKFLGKLPPLRKLALQIGSGYLTSKELRQIMNELNKMTTLSFLAFFSDFSKITPKEFTAFVNSLKLLEKKTNLTQAIIAPDQYYHANRKNFDAFIQGSKRKFYFDEAMHLDKISF